MIRFIRHFMHTVSVILEVPRFIRENKLWQGFWDHKIVLLALLVAGGLFSWHLYEVYRNWWEHLNAHNPVEATIQATFLVKDLAIGSYQFMFAGAYKYLLLIIMELLIFHMTFRTHEILDGRKESLSPARFIMAQVRMVKVTVFTYFMELVATIIIRTALTITGFEFLSGLLIFVIQCFFFGFVLIDNYNEIHHLKIRESYRHTVKFAGVAVAIGLLLHLLIIIPLIGPFVGPMTGAIVATLVMHDLEDAMIMDKDQISPGI